MNFYGRGSGSSDLNPYQLHYLATQHQIKRTAEAVSVGMWLVLQGFAQNWNCSTDPVMVWFYPLGITNVCIQFHSKKSTHSSTDRALCHMPVVRPLPVFPFSLHYLITQWHRNIQNSNIFVHKTHETSWQDWLGWKSFYLLTSEGRAAVSELEGCLLGLHPDLSLLPESWCRHDATLSKTCLRALYL